MIFLEVYLFGFGTFLFFRLIDYWEGNIEFDRGTVFIAIVWPLYLVFLLVAFSVVGIAFVEQLLRRRFGT